MIATTLLLKALGARDIALVGSTYAIGVGQDIDLLALVEDMALTARKLVELGWAREGDNYAQDDGFLSLRKGDVNILLCRSAVFFARTKLAAEVTKVLRLESKDDRIKVYRVIRDGATAEDL